MLRSALAALAVLLPLAALAQTTQHPFSFTRVPAGLPTMRDAMAAWADYDGDGDLDLFLTGDERITAEGDYALRAYLYRNDGVVADPSVPGGQRPVFASVGDGLTPMAYGDAAWADYDGDGDLDLLVTGSTTAARPYAARTVLYRNDAGRLVEVAAGLADLHSGALAWADHDGDGDLDLLVTGTAAAAAPYVPETHLYLNTAGSFEEAATALPGLVFGALAWQPLAGGARPDVYLSGLTPDGLVTRVYEHRDGQYAAVSSAPGVLHGQARVVPRAGAPAARALTGAVPSRTYLTGHTLVGGDVESAQVFGGGVDFGDLDGDGDLDFTVTGVARQFAGAEHRVYQAQDDALAEKNLLLGTTGGPVHLLDYDGDGDLDLFAAGTTTALYRNDRPPSSFEALRPSGLVATPHAGGVTLAWAPGAAPGTTYDVWVGTAPDRFDVVSPPALAATGTRTLSAPGRVGAAPEVTLHLPPGTYYWGVQQVTAERVGSPFATGLPFTLATTDGAAPEVPATFGLDAPAPSPFTTEARLRYHLPAPHDVTLAVFDLTGRRVRTLVDAPQPAGSHAATWDGRDEAGVLLASGLYLCRFAAGAFTSSRTLLFVR